MYGLCPCQSKDLSCWNGESHARNGTKYERTVYASKTFRPFFFYFRTNDVQQCSNAVQVCIIIVEIRST